MKIKALLIASTLATSVTLLHTNTAIAGGIPVIDTASIAKYIEQIASMKEQIENQVQQIVELKNQVQAVTGGRDMGNLLRDQLGVEIPDEWKDIYNATDRLADGKIKERLGSFDSQASDKGLFAMLDNTEKTFDDIKKRVSRIEELTTSINNTQDIKASQDLQARIQAEQLAISNQQVKLDQMKRMYELEKELDEKRKVMNDQCGFKNWGQGTSTPCN